MTATTGTLSEMALDARRVDFTSTINGRTYRLFVSIPGGPAPERGHPVVYLIDGNLHFGIAVDTARIQSRWPDVLDPVVVGIGYPTSSVTEALAVRNRDLTSPISAERLALGWLGTMNSKADEFGEVDAYLQVIEKEIKPRIAELASVDVGDAVLMGHSLGGLTTLHALFRWPKSFAQYVAISPSIWWNDAAVLAYETAFARRAEAGEVDARVQLSVGALESTPRFVPGLPFSEVNLREMNEDCRMVDNVRELGARLAGLKAPGLVVETFVSPGDDHNTVPAAAIARGVRFTMRRSDRAAG